MLFSDVEKIFFENSIKCGSHKKILSDLRNFDEEMDIDTLKSLTFLDQSIELIFDLSNTCDLIVNLPQYYPFKNPELYILDKKNRKIDFREFISKKRNKNVNKEHIFKNLDQMFVHDIPAISLVKILEEIMAILQLFKLGWFSNK